jgi:hypothetical protein
MVSSFSSSVRQRNADAAGTEDKTISGICHKRIEMRFQAAYLYSLTQNSLFRLHVLTVLHAPVTDEKHEEIQLNAAIA